MTGKEHVLFDSPTIPIYDMSKRPAAIIKFEASNIKPLWSSTQPSCYYGLKMYCFLEVKNWVIF